MLLSSTAHSTGPRRLGANERLNSPPEIAKPVVLFPELISASKRVGR